MGRLLTVWHLRSMRAMVAVSWTSAWKGVGAEPSPRVLRTEAEPGHLAGFVERDELGAGRPGRPRWSADTTRLATLGAVEDVLPRTCRAEQAELSRCQLR
jgi:hypothetical protein